MIESNRKIFVCIAKERIGSIYNFIIFSSHRREITRVKIDGNRVLSTKIEIDIDK